MFWVISLASDTTGLSSSPGIPSGNSRVLTETRNSIKPQSFVELLGVPNEICWKNDDEPILCMIEFSYHCDKPILYQYVSLWIYIHLLSHYVFNLPQFRIASLAVGVAGRCKMDVVEVLQAFGNLHGLVCLELVFGKWPMKRKRIHKPQDKYDGLYY